MPRSQWTGFTTYVYRYDVRLPLCATCYAPYYPHNCNNNNDDDDDDDDDDKHLHEHCKLK